MTFAPFPRHCAIQSMDNEGGQDMARDKARAEAEAYPEMLKTLGLGGAVKPPSVNAIPVQNNCRGLIARGAGIERYRAMECRRLG